MSGHFCKDCRRTVRTVADVRNCARCKADGAARHIPENHSDTDILTPLIMGYALAGAFEPSAPSGETEQTPSFVGGGGDTAGSGSGGSWDSGSSDSGSSSGSDSSSSDSGSSSGGGE